MREATTRYVDIPCKDRATGQPFDFSGFSVQTWVQFGSTSQYVPTAVDGSTVRYKIPATLSLGAKNGVAETRIFQSNGDVFEVLQVRFTVFKAEKPDTEWHEAEA